MTYYKWLTPTMRSHYDPGYQWRLGETHVADGDRGPSDDPGHGLYLLKDPVDALRFGHWPGRLFEAEPLGPVLEESDEKVRCLAVRLLREHDAGEVFGPHGERVVAFVDALRAFPWLRRSGPLAAAIEAAEEYQRRLASWGWAPLPVAGLSFSDLEPAIDAAKAVDPAVASGASTAWATSEHPWKTWTAPWAAWAGWDAASEGVRGGFGVAALAGARAIWTGPAAWPAPHDRRWSETIHAVGTAVNLIAASASRHAATAAEYLVCSDGLPADPFPSLMEVWRLGYWPAGVIDGRYVIGDLSSVSWCLTPPGSPVLDGAGPPTFGTPK